MNEQQMNQYYEQNNLQPNEYDRDPQKDFKGIWIPKELLYNPELSALEKLFIMEVFSYKSGKCWKSNKQLAKVLCIASESVSRLVKRMVEKKMIHSKIDKNNFGTVRVLTLTQGGLDLCRGGINPTSREPLTERQPSKTIESRTKSILSSNKLDSPQQAVDPIQWDKFLKFINTTTGRQFKLINEATRKKFRARIKEGYTKTDFQNALIAATKDKEFMEKFGNYVTPEWLSREKTMERWATAPIKKQQQGGASYDTDKILQNMERQRKEDKDWRESLKTQGSHGGDQ